MKTVLPDFVAELRGRWPDKLNVTAVQKTDATKTGLVSAEKEKGESVETKDEKVEEAFILEEGENETIESEAENACGDKIKLDSGENVHDESVEIEEVDENEKSSEILSEAEKNQFLRKLMTQQVNILH